MMQIFNFFGNIFGYLLWFLYTVFENYGIAIILFTLIIKVLMFPSSLNQQKNMAKQRKMTEKQQELQKKYGNDKQKMNEELQKLYEKEGFNPSSGCLTTLIPFPIMLGIYYSVIYPLKNTLHIAAAKVEAATAYVSKLPGVASSNNYVELEIVKNWDVLKDKLTMFDAKDIEKIEFFTEGFEFLGLDLLGTPKGAPFMEMLWLIPVLCLVSSWAMTFYMNKQSGVKQQGCMNVTMYMMPLLSAYWAFIMPAAVGFYWVISTVFSAVQSIITNNFFSINHMTAMNEAQHFVSMTQAEEAYKPLPGDLQRQIAEKIESQNNASTASDDKKQNKNQSSSKKKGKSGKSASDYMGNKK